MLNFDEINRLSQNIYIVYMRNKSLKEAEDAFFDFLVDCYLLGLGYEALDSFPDLREPRISPDLREAQRIINQKVADENWRERLKKHLQAEDANAVKVLAETEGHRVHEESALAGGIRSGAKYKIWCTMRDNRVRDTHDYLEGMKVPIQDKFFTFDGDSALYPGGFGKAQNNVNCRCYIKTVKS